MITDKLAIENYLLIDIDDSFDDQLDDWIAAIEVEMNRMTDRQLIADDTAAEYKFDGTGKKAMMIEDFIDIDTVEVLSSKTDTEPEDITEYCYFYPSNKLPIYQLQADDRIFPKGRQNIVITGKRGYAAEADLPADLKFAATVLVAGIINASNQHEGEIKSESIGRWTVTYKDEKQKGDFSSAITTIKSYRRIR